ncbi:MAG: PorT family protein [Flavisolibacter sp.]|nr:PorT family protein [Flavisolibacter sp.]
MKMKTLTLGFIATISATMYTQAQSGGQFRAGINLANVSVNANGRVNNANQLTSFHAGFVGNVPIGGILYFQPGLLFTGKGSKTQSGDPSSGTYFKATTNPYYIEVPANLVLKAPVGTNRFFAGAGPYLSMGIAGKNKTEGKYLGFDFNSERNIRFSNDDPTTTNYEEGAGFGIMRRFDYGVNGTAGIEGKSIVAGVNYGLGLAKLQSGSNSSADDNNKHRVLSFFVGFKF